MRQVIPIESFKVACSNCNLRELCMPVGLNDSELTRIEHLVGERRSVAKGETLFAQNAPFEALYAVRTGFFKTTVTTADGHAQVTGFQMAGEILGMDGVAFDRHSCDASALENSQVCVLPYADLESLTREIAGLHTHVHKMMSREIVREHGVMLLLGSMSAQVRLAVFLLNLFERMGARGYSTQEMNLRMTRQDIGNYLGLKIETVSRTFSQFVQEGLIALTQRHIKVLDSVALRRLANLEACS